MVTILCQSIKQVNCLTAISSSACQSALTRLWLLLAPSFLMPCCFCVPMEAPRRRDTKYQVCASMLAHNESELSKSSPFDPSFHCRGDADNETEHHHWAVSLCPLVVWECVTWQFRDLGNTGGEKWAELWTLSHACMCQYTVCVCLLNFQCEDKDWALIGAWDYPEKLSVFEILKGTILR